MTPASQYLTDCRKRAKVTQMKLAYALGVTQQLISAWEAGKAPIPAHRFPDLVKFIQLDIQVMKSCMLETYAEKLNVVPSENS